MKPAAVLASAALLIVALVKSHAQAPEPVAEAAAAPAPPSLRSVVDALSEAELAEVMTLLKGHFTNQSALSDLEIRRATVQGLLDRLAPGAAILPEASNATAAASSAFRHEILEDRIGYVRLGAIGPAHVAELETALRKFAASKLTAVVLDLRATPPGSDFEQTAEVCKRFCPKGRVIFSIKKPSLRQEQILTSKDDPIFRGTVVVLVDSDTAGDAEVIAAVLRTHVNALIIGQQTKGEAVEFADFPLASGKVMRIAVAEVELPEKGSVFPGGVRPDLVVEVPQEVTETLLQQEQERGVREFVFETERPRMNEAALVAGTNPEIDALQAAQKARAEKSKPPLRDAVLQRAVDFITTIAIYERKGK